MAEKLERWLVQLVVPVGTYSGADDVVHDLEDLIEGNSEFEVVSAELDTDQVEDDSAN